MTDPKSFISTPLSAPADVHDAVSSSVLSALQCEEGNDDKETVKSTNKVQRALFAAEENEDVETGSRISKNAVSGSPDTNARKATNVDEFQRKFETDERPLASEMVAGTAPQSLQPTRGTHHDTSEDDSTLQSLSGGVSESDKSSSYETTSKASTGKGRYAREARHDSEKRASSETKEEQKKRRKEKRMKQERKEKEKNIAPFESSALSSANEQDTVSSAVLISALKGVESDNDGDEEKKVKATPKVHKASFVAEENGDIETGSRLPQEPASVSHNPNARKVTYIIAFQRKLESEEQPSRTEMIAATASQALQAIEPAQHETSGDDTNLRSLAGVSKSEKSSSYKTVKGKDASESRHDSEKKVLSETKDEKKKRRQERREKKEKKEREMSSSKSFVSTALSSVDEQDSVSSAVLFSALKCVKGYIGDKDKQEKAKTKEKEDTETGSRLLQEPASGSYNTNTRQATNVIAFQRKFESDEQLSRTEVMTTTAPLALRVQESAHHDTSDDVNSLQSLSGVAKTEHSSSHKTESKASTRKGIYTSEIRQESKKSISETKVEKKKHRKEKRKKKEKKEKEMSRRPLESTEISSAVFSPVKYADGNDEEVEDKAKATLKVHRASFVAEENEDIETGARLPQEPASWSPDTNSRQPTNVNEFQRKFESDDKLTRTEMAAATVPLALQAQVSAHRDTSEDDTNLQSMSRVSKSKKSSSSNIESKVSTVKGKDASETRQDSEKRPISQTKGEKKKWRQERKEKREKKEKEMSSSKSFVSTALSSAEEHDDAATSAVLSALNYAAENDYTDNKATPKVHRASFVAAEENKDNGTGYRRSPSRARRVTNVVSFQRKFDRDERPPPDAMAAASPASALATNTNSGSPSRARRVTNVVSFQRKFDRDERPPTDAMAAAASPASALATNTNSGSPSRAIRVTNVDSFQRKFDRDERPPTDAMAASASPASALATNTRRRKLSRDEQPSSAPPGVLTSNSPLVLPQGRQSSSPGALHMGPLALQAQVPAQYDDGDEQSSTGATLAASVVDTRHRELERDEQPLVTQTEALDSSLPQVLIEGEPHLRVEGSGLTTESHENFELHTTLSPSPREQSVLVEATLVTEDPHISSPHISTAMVVVAEPLPNRECWHWSKFQCGCGLILLMILVGIAVGVAVGGGGSSVDGSKPTISPTLSSSPPIRAPSTAPSSVLSLVPSPAPSSILSLAPSTAPSTSSLKQFLAQSLPTYSQDAILGEDTPEAQAFAWLQDDPSVSNYTNLEVLQRYALATLYYATNGNTNWVKNSGWLFYNRSSCDWFMGDNTGCIDDNRQYTKLVLESNGLSGELPDALGIMTDLKVINLRKNGLKGQLPSALEFLTQLTDLSLDTNALAGTIPSVYGALASLENLMLFRNDLTGQIPSTLGSLTRLTDLRIASNLLDGSVPSEFGFLVNLRELSIFSNQLTGQLPSTLGSLSLLTSFSLHSNRLSGPIPSEFGLMVNLKFLNLFKNELVGQLPSTMGSMSLMTSLGLNDNFLSGPIPTEFGFLVNLGWLQLYNNDLTGQLPSTLGSLSRLTNLGIRDNSLSGSLPSEFGLLVSLQDLELRGNLLTGQLPSTLGSLSQLTHLSFSRNLLSGPIPSAYEALLNLQELHLDVNDLTGSLPSTLGSLSRLTNLDLTGNLLSGPVPSEYSILTELQSLQLDDNDLTGRLPSTLGSLSLLKFLYLNGNLLSGPVPSEYGNLLSLEYMYLNANNFTGSIPSTLGSLTRLKALWLYGNELSGSVPEELCQLIETNDLDLAVDCDLVACDCGCNCK